MVEYLMENRSDIRNYKNPYSCGGEPSDLSEERKIAQRDIKHFGYSASLQAWYAPFFMAGTNTRIVRRSMAGLNCDYNEVMTFSGSFALIKAFGTWFRGTLLQTLMIFACFRRFLSRMVPPGTGPSDEVQKAGKWAMVVAAESNNTFVYGDVVG